MPRKLKRSTLINKLDIIFSKYIRLSNADKNGYCECFTCGKKLKWNKGIDAGHFMSRKNLSTRWDERNVKPQCKYCNNWGAGEQYKFSMMLGAELSDELFILSKKTIKFSNYELIEMYDYYKNIVKDLEKHYI